MTTSNDGDDNDDDDERVRWIERYVHTTTNDGDDDAIDVHGFDVESRRRVKAFLDGQAARSGEALVVRVSACTESVEHDDDDDDDDDATVDGWVNVPAHTTEGVTAADEEVEDDESGGEYVDVVPPERVSSRRRRQFRLIVVDNDDDNDAHDVPMVFFTRSCDGDARMTLDDVKNSMCGYFPRGATLDALHATLRHSFAPALASHEDSAHRSFARDVHAFLEHINSVESRENPITTRGAREDGGVEFKSLPALGDIDPDVACEDVEFIRQLEGALREWCAVLSAAKARCEDDATTTPSSSSDVRKGPLAEIHHWRAQCADLSSLLAQVNEPGMTTALSVLEKFIHKHKATASRAGGGATKSKMRVNADDDIAAVVSHVARAYASLVNDVKRLRDVGADNVKILSTLESHFNALSDAPLHDVAQVIAPTMCALRMVWIISHHYNDDSRMGALMSRIADVLVDRVRNVVSHRDVFARASKDGIRSALRDVQSSKAIMHAWKREYLLAREEIEQSNRDSRWEFDRERLFANSDYAASVCEELTEMVVVANDFRTFLSPRLKAVTLDADGVDEISARVDAMCLAIETTTIDDVFDSSEAPRWKAAYASFIKEKTRIERGLCHFIDACFKRLRNSAGAFELVQELKHAMHEQTDDDCSLLAGSTRATLNNQILGKMQDVLEQFSREIDAARHMFNTKRRCPPLNRDQPPVAGSIHWARSLFYKLRVTMRLFTACVHDQDTIRNTPAAQQVNAKFVALAKLVMNYEKQRLSTWKDDIENTLTTCLTLPVLAKNDQLDLYVNFRPELASLIKETQDLERLGFEVPPSARGVALQNEKYRSYQSSLGNIISRRKTLLDSLTPLEEQLLTQRISALNGTALRPGLTTYNWNSLGIPDFVRSYDIELDGFTELLTDVRACARDVELVVGKVATTTLVDFERLVKLPNVCESGEFFARFAKQCRHAASKLREEYLTIMRLLINVETIVFGTSTGEHAMLAEYYRHWEGEIYEALIVAVKNTVENFRQYFDRASAYEFSLFKINIALHAGEIVCEPPVKELMQSITYAAKSVASSLSVLGRWMDGTCLEVPTRTPTSNGDVSLSTLLAIELGDYAATPTHDFNFGIELLEDDGVFDSLSTLNNTTHLFISEIRRRMEHWRRYQYIWKDDKDLICGKFVQNPNPIFIQRELLRYEDVRKSMDGDSGVRIGAVFVSANKLTSTIKSLSMEWIENIGAATYEVDISRMAGIYEYYERCEKIFATESADFGVMKVLMKTVRDVRKDSETELKCIDINNRFAVRRKYGIKHSDDNIMRASSMIPAFDALRLRAELVCDDVKLKLIECKSELRDQTRAFQEECNEFVAKLASEGPTCADLLQNLDAGYEKFETLQEEVQVMIETLDDIRDSERVFGVEHASFDSLIRAKVDIESMGSIYECQRAYRDQLHLMHDTLISDVVISNVQASVVVFGRSQLEALPERLHSHRLFAAIQEDISDIETDLNLIDGLKLEAIRPRHWQAMFKLVGVSDSSELSIAQLTMRHLIEMQPHVQAQKIMDITTAAEKELKIENDLSAIDRSWSEMRFDLRPYSKGTSKKHSQPTHVLCAVEEITLALEDTGLTLQSMAASRYANPMIETVREWEATLSLVSNVLQVWTDTQQRWMYLLSIFGGSDDIRMQLPEEADRFDKIDTAIRKLMTETVKTKFVLDMCKSEGRLEMLQSLRGDLEICQKSLSQYLDTKRDAFPRFFFISDEELLSILGTSDPTLIQEHMLKLFDNCAKLIFASDQKSVVGVASAEGESFKFKSPVKIQGPVEVWMSAVEEEIRMTLRALCKYGVARYLACNRDAWIKEQLGMITLVGSQIWWTWEVQSVFEAIRKGNKLAMRNYSEKLTKQLELLTQMVRGELSSCERKKVNTLIIIDVHARDIIDSLVRNSVLDESDFAWESQLRFKWDKLKDDIIINQCSGEFRYGYEYMGLNGRLVITGLTDRCYITLTTALTYRLGGAPSGPAGTGKTETTKDLAKSMALLCVVFNCGEGLDYKAMGAIFSGLVQCGAWGCFDEFNRIEAEVLSVVSSQIKQIQEALKHNLKRFQFEGKEIKCDSRTGVFITMNPGYAGRTELPDNLKALFRPVTMIVPDLEQICEIMLFSEGFNSAKPLAKKMTMLYRLAKEQLSKQSHYDFGLRALKSVLVMAGSLKRDSPELAEDVVLMRALRDMNLPKFVFDDVQLFLGLINDLFPGLACPRISYPALNAVIEKDLAEHGYQIMSQPGEQVDKIIQLYETMLTRHTTMLVGETGGGKSVILETIARAQTAMGRNTKLYILNPKAQSVSELYGELDPDTRDWTDGLLSNIFREANKPLPNGRENDFKYIVFDGDVDAVWVENMNSVMDDNRLLTLPNGERIRLQDHCKLLFEVADLKYASPATVSRCGMVYVDPKNLGHKPFLKTWCDGVNQAHRTLLEKLFEKYLDAVDAFCFRGVDLDGSIIASPRMSLERPMISVVKQCCVLLKNFLNTLDASSISDAMDKNVRAVAIESALVFSITWSFGATIVETVGQSDRQRFDKFLKTLANRDYCMPSEHTLYDYGFDITRNSWYEWASLTTPLTASPETPFSSILVSTAHTIRTNWLIDVMCANDSHTLLTGDSGTSKTVVVKNYLQERLKDGKTNTVTMNFSSRTTAADVHSSIMDVVDKRTKDIVGPPVGKRLLCFVDDLNMPGVDTYGTQQPIALLKLMIGRSGTYNRGKELNWLQMKDIQYIAAMGHPGGARSVVDPRFVSMFQVFEMQTPDESNLRVIYGSIIRNTSKSLNLAAGSDEVIVDMTLDLYKSVVAKLLPTPSRFHYIFNLRDLSRIFEGMSRATPAVISTTPEFIRLWRNEAIRVFHDRLISNEDRTFVLDRVASLIRERCDEEYKDEITVMSSNPTLFADFAPGDDHEDSMRSNASHVVDASGAEVTDSLIVRKRVYEDVGTYAAIKPWFEQVIANRNAQLKDGSTPMQLVLFDHALEHLTRIHRVLRTENGHALLVGVGGSGKQSLARLAAEMADCKVFEITLARGYNDTTFREDLKKLYNILGVQNLPTMFLFTDNHVVEEGFLELINNMLTTGTVPALFADEEKDAMVNAIREDLLSNKIPVNREDGWRYLIDRCRTNLHIVLAMSPIGDQLRHRCRNFPGLVNNTVIDWFTEWPKDALLEVSASLLLNAGVPEEFTSRINEHVMYTHCTAIALNEKFKKELKRHNYVTPKHYLEFITAYETSLNTQRSTIDASIKRLSGGLDKLIQASTEVDAMRTKLNDAQVVVTQQATECDELLDKITKRTSEVETKASNASSKEEELVKDSARIAKEKTEAEADLEAAIPALEEAAAALNNLKKDEITEIRSFAKPNIAVQRVCECVMILKGLPNVSWTGAKGMMADTNFLRSLVEFDKDGIKEKQMKALREYTKDSKFNPDEVMKISTAGAGLLKWVFAMINYNKVARTVNPKRAAVETAEKTLRIKERELAETKAELKSLQAELKQLSSQFEEKSAKQQDLKQSAELMANRLNAAERLITGLSSEKIRWTTEMQELRARKEKLIGDCLLTSAFLCYAGTFTFEFRKQFIHDFLESNLRTLGVPLSEPFNLQALLTDDNELNSWAADGLPGDELSVQNGMLTMRAKRFPLCIDPQMQAVKWIKSREGSALEGKVKRQTDADFLKQLELAIQYGLPFLIENVGEYIDPVLNPVLNKSFHYAPNGAKMIKLGDSEVEWDDNFRLYMTTKLPNPHYDPDVSGKMIIINYSVTEAGLQEQLLNVTVKQERPDLETERENLVKETVTNRALLKTLEDTLLHELSIAQGEIVDNVELIETLESAKTKSTEISEKLILAAQAAKELFKAQSCYSPVAKRGAILFFVVSALSNLNPMYEYSLSSFLDVFINTLRATQPNDDLDIRLSSLIDRLTYDVYKFACLGLFERDKLALSFQMTTRIEDGEGRMNAKLLVFFLKGNVSLDNASADVERLPWWSERGWQDLVHLDTHIAKECVKEDSSSSTSALSGVLQRILVNADEWRAWYSCEKPEASALPDGYSDSLSSFERLCLLRCARLDRVTSAVSNYICETMGVRFVTPPISDYESIYKLSSAFTPVVFVLSPGADPAFDIFALGENMGFKPGGKLKFMALGQGMGAKAEELIESCASRGLWLMLQNCHLLPKWLSTLEKVIDGLVEPHKDFRLWLTTDPIKTFPIGILQRSLKVVTEPPDGLKMNMKASYARLSEDVLSGCRNEFFRALTYVLAFFHAAVQERRKYGKLGWNVAYDFNETDFRISFSLIKTYCAKVSSAANNGSSTKMIPWTALKYLIGEAMYGGRVSDNYDRRVLNAYLDEYFGDFLFDGFQQFMFYSNGATNVHYALPSKDASYDAQIESIDSVPDMQTPEVLGLHSNADVAHSTRAAKSLWSNVLSLQSKLVAVAPASATSTQKNNTGTDVETNTNENSVLTNIVNEILLVVTNDAYAFDVAKIQRQIIDESSETPSPTTVVLFQELERHNALKDVLKHSLRELVKALSGEIGMSPELDAISDALSRGRVPDKWKSAAPPTDKDVQSWIAWYKRREKQFKSWSTRGEPKVMWLSGLHCPETYIAALIQSACRLKGWPLDASAMYTEVTEFTREDEILAKPELGCYITGLFLEGASWDHHNQCLASQHDKVLVSELPILRLVPTQTTARSQSSTSASSSKSFKCPVYFTQNRRDAMGRGLVFEADLTSVDHPALWTLQGVALCLNTDF